jgi:hypothetical protein
MEDGSDQRQAVNLPPPAPTRFPLVLAVEIPTPRPVPDSSGSPKTDRGNGKEQSTWGEERIAADLRLKLAVRVSPYTVRCYLFDSQGQEARLRTPSLQVNVSPMCPRRIHVGRHTSTSLRAGPFESKTRMNLLARKYSKLQPMPLEGNTTLEEPTDRRSFIFGT